MCQPCSVGHAGSKGAAYVLAKLAFAFAALAAFRLCTPACPEVRSQTAKRQREKEQPRQLHGRVFDPRGRDGLRLRRSNLGR